MNLKIFIPVLVLGSIALLGCTSSERIGMDPATVLKRDVFTCKGLTEQNRWVGVTDEFLPEKDPRVVVVAQIAEEDKETILNYELRNPQKNIAFTEEKPYPRTNPLGVYFEMSTIMDRGGEGEWVATVYSDGMPIGQKVFYIGEKPEEMEEIEGPTYYIVGDEEEEDTIQEPLSDEERFSGYIQEVTPEERIDTTQPSPVDIAPATP
jgi:hypothetical protein